MINLKSPCCNHSDDPFTYMPQVPREKKLLTKRFLCVLEDDHHSSIFCPMLSSVNCSPKSNDDNSRKTTPTFSNKNNTSTISRQSSSNKFRTTQQPSSIKFQTSLLRLLDGTSLQQLKDRRDGVITKTETEIAVVLEGDTIAVEEVDVTNSFNNQTMLLSSAPDIPLLLSSSSSLVESGGGGVSSFNEMELPTKTQTNNGVVILGKGIPKRDSAVANSA